MTTPEALDLLDKAAGLPAGADMENAKPLGAFGLVGALSDPQVKEGLGVPMELTRGLAQLRR